MIKMIRLDHTDPGLALALVGEWLRTLQDPEIPGLPKMGWYGVAPVPDHKIGD